METARSLRAKSNNRSLFSLYLNCNDESQLNPVVPELVLVNQYFAVTDADADVVLLKKLNGGTLSILLGDQSYMMETHGKVVANGGHDKQSSAIQICIQCGQGHHPTEKTLHYECPFTLQVNYVRTPQTFQQLLTIFAVFMEKIQRMGSS